MNRRVYLGDGVYADHDGYQLWLITSNGIEDTNAIALDSSVFESLLEYVKSLSRSQFQSQQPAVVRADSKETNS